METKKFLENEEKIATAGKEIILTNFRIRFQSQGIHFTSMMLEKISTIQVHYKSYLMALISGVLLILGGGVFIGMQFQNQYFDPTPGIIGIAGGLLLIAIFFITRKHTIKITASCGTKIEFITKGMKSESVIDFIDKIEDAKNKRYLSTKS